MDMARQVWDESRHVEIYLRPARAPGRLRRRVPGDDAPVAVRLRRGRRGPRGRREPGARGAGLRRVQPARCTSPGRSAIPILERSVDYVLADEITHVRMGSQLAQRAHRGRPRAPPPGHRVPGVDRRALQPGRHPPGRRTTTWCRSPSPPRTRGAWPASPTRRSSGSSRPRSAPRSTSRDRCIPARAVHFDRATIAARRIRHYRYAEERMMRMLGGWIALTPELRGQAAARPPRVGLRPARRPVGQAAARAAGAGPASEPASAGVRGASWTRSRASRARRRRSSG